MGNKIFSAAAFFICFREAIEASLIVGIMLSYTKRTGNQRYNKYIWWGTWIALALSMAFGIGFAIPYWVSDNEVFEGKAEYIFEGILSLVAGGLLTWMILWTTKMGHTLSQHIEEKLEEAIETGEAWRMFLLPFIQILREGIETVIFIFGVGEGGDWEAIPLPGILGVIVAVVLSYLLFKGSINIDIIRLLQICSYILMFFAAGLMSYGFHELQEANWFGRYKNYGKYPAFSDTTSVPDVLRGVTGQTMWSTKKVMHDTDNEFGALMRALLGYQDTPTFMEIFPYMLYWIVTLGLLHYNNIVNGLTHRKVVGKLATFAKLACSFAFLWGFLQFVWSCSVDWHPWVGFVSSILAMGLFGVAFYAQTILSGSDYARRATLALVYLGGAVFWHVFMLVVMAVQIDDLSKCLDASDVLAGFAKAYKGHEEDMLQDKDYLAVTQSLARLEDLDGVAVTLDGEICGARRFGNSFAHQLFIFNTDHIRGTRHEGYWNGGATIIMAFLINMFSGAFHIGYAYHLWRFYSQIAQGVVEPLGTETKTLPTTKEDVSEQLY